MHLALQTLDAHRTPLLALTLHLLLLRLLVPQLEGPVRLIELRDLVRVRVRVRVRVS